VMAKRTMPVSASAKNLRSPDGAHRNPELPPRPSLLPRISPSGAHARDRRLHPGYKCSTNTDLVARMERSVIREPCQKPSSLSRIARSGARARDRWLHPGY
jgi:hypothetical protein